MPSREDEDVDEPETTTCRRDPFDKAFQNEIRDIVDETIAHSLYCMSTLGTAMVLYGPCQVFFKKLLVMQTISLLQRLMRASSLLFPASLITNGYLLLEMRSDVLVGLLA